MIPSYSSRSTFVTGAPSLPAGGTTRTPPGAVGILQIMSDAAGPDPGSDRHELVLVVLAAGAGSRFDGPDHKLTATIAGEAVIARSVTAALTAGVGPVVVVTGAATGLPLPASDRLHVVYNPNWQQGQSSSLRVGLEAAGRLGADAVVVGLGDQPFVSPEAWRLVAASGAPIAVATYGGRRRNPVRLHRDVWPLLSADGDEGARSLIALRPDLVEEIPCPGSAADIDTREDLRTWQSRSSTSSP